MKTTLMLILLAAGSRMGYASACQDTPINWTMYLNYTDPMTGLAMNSKITGDGVQTDGSGNTVYADGHTIVRLNDCGTGASGDATLATAKSRGFNVNVGISEDDEYGKYPPTTVFSNVGGLINVSNVTWCQNNGHPNGCTFYTRMTVNFSGPDGNDYRLRMENPTSVPVKEWAMDSAGNCAYTTSPVQVVFTPAALSASNKDTYVVTPALQGTNTSNGWVAPAANGGCPTSTLPAGTWPAALGVLVGATTGNSYNYGQYDTPFQFVIQAQ
jgi:prepilin-type processing-associated H-X9-DG protein